MKYRNGFVSNSSSSSFVVVVAKETADKVLGGMDKYDQSVINFIRKDQTFLGKNVSVFTCMTGNMSSWEWEWDIKKEARKAGITESEAPYVDEVWENFRDRLKKETRDMISHQESC
jgi:hypothetical protein